jgi:hypothetical protein
MTTPLVVAPDPLAAFPGPVRWALTRQPLSEPLLPRLQPQLTLEQVYALCLAQGLVPDALRVIAAVLPVRESIWWAWVSVRYAMQREDGTPPSAEAHAAVSAIEQWIVRPDDENRRTAWQAGRAAGVDTPAGMVAAAVYLSGGSVAPPGVTPVPPPPGGTLPLITGAILLSAVGGKDPAQLPATMQAFAAQGLEIVKRLGGWPAALQLAHESHQRAVLEYQRATGSDGAAGAPR